MNQVEVPSVAAQVRLVMTVQLVIEDACASVGWNEPPLERDAAECRKGLQRDLDACQDPGEENIDEVKREQLADHFNGRIS
jgi:hypothetical protein